MKRSFRTDPTLRGRRASIRAFWTLNPATPAREVAARFGVSESTALDAKPYHLRSVRCVSRSRASEAELLSLRLSEAGWPPEEIAEATGRSITTTRRYLRAITKGKL